MKKTTAPSVTINKPTIVVGPEAEAHYKAMNDKRARRAKLWKETKAALVLLGQIGCVMCIAAVVVSLIIGLITGGQKVTEQWVKVNRLEEEVARLKEVQEGDRSDLLRLAIKQDDAREENLRHFQKIDPFVEKGVLLQKSTSNGTYPNGIQTPLMTTNAGIVFTWDNITNVVTWDTNTIIWVTNMDVQFRRSGGKLR